MTYYERKRNQLGITRSDMVDMLGIDYMKYVAIEKGERKMPVNLIDKFNSIINKGKNELEFEKLNRQALVNEWFEDMTTVVNGRIKLKNKMEEFNIESYKELATLMGYKTACNLSIYCNKTRPAPYDFKNRLYTFFADELNIQDKKKTVILNKEKMTHEEKNELTEWYKTFDIHKWLEKNNLTIGGFPEYIPMPKSTFYYYCNPRGGVMPTKTTIKKVKEAVERYENGNSEETEVTPSSDNSVSVENIDKDTNIIEGKEINIDDIQEEIDDLKDVNPVEETSELNHYTKGLEGSLKENQQEVTKLNSGLQKAIGRVEVLLAKAKADVLVYEDILKDLKGE